LVGPYRVIYRMRKPIIRVLTIYHGARQLRPEDLPP
jgi:hypothetical protein